MKILAGASFEYWEEHHDEELKFIIFGPVVKKAWVERWYSFRDSKKRDPDALRRFTENEGKTIIERQKREPVLIWERGSQRIYFFRNLFVKCEKEEETVAAVRGLVLEKLERDERRLERLKKKGSQ